MIALPEGKSMKIIDAIWFTEHASTRPIGIVIVEDEHTGKIKAYIGTGHGYDEGVDAYHIVSNGAKLDPSITMNIAKRLDKEV